VFPGEVLAGLFRTLGDVRAVLSGMAAACAVLVVAAVVLAFGAIVAARAQDHAVLRAIGAPPGFVLLALWMELGAVLVVGVAAGIALGWAGAAAAGAALGRSAGVQVAVTPGWVDAGLALVVLAGGLLAAAVPALVGSQVSLGRALKT